MPMHKNGSPEASGGSKRGKCGICGRQISANQKFSVYLLPEKNEATECHKGCWALYLKRNAK